MVKHALALGLAASVLPGLVGCSSMQSQGAFRIKEAILRQPVEGMQGELEWSGVIAIGRGRTEHAVVEVTSKGNGFLKISGDSFRVYDAHDDGQVFEPSMLNVTFVDLDNDGYRDLVLEGEVVHTDDRSGERRAPMWIVYRYDAGNRRFELASAR